MNQNNRSFNLAALFPKDIQDKVTKLIQSEKHASHVGALDLAAKRRMAKDGLKDQNHARERHANQKLQTDLRNRHGKDIISVSK